MLLTEQTMARAARKLANELRVARPVYWTPAVDQVWIRNVLFPSLFMALQEIEDVKPCFGFDLDRAADAYIAGEY